MSPIRDQQRHVFLTIPEVTPSGAANAPQTSSFNTEMGASVLGGMPQ